MRLSHPMAPYRGLPPEDVFFVANDMQVQMGTGYVMRFFQYELYPAQPLHVYIQIEAQPSARNLLLGALLARAEQLRAETPHLKGRIYAEVMPDDPELIAFYQKNGFKNDDTEELLRFPLPAYPVRTPMSCQLASVPLRNESEQDLFLARLNAYRIPGIDRDFLTLCMQQQHFLAIGFYKGREPVSEALFSGSGAQATLILLYVRADFRRKGVAKALLGSAADILRSRGATHVLTQTYTRNVQQAALMRSLSADRLRTVTLFPGLEL
jgi:GNAT superfamily N-acetyltransferase